MKLHMKILDGMWVRSLQKILRDPFLPQIEQSLKQTSKLPRDNLLLHSRWARFNEYLKFGEENHFLRTLGLLQYIQSTSRSDRFSGIRYLIQKLKKQDFSEEAVRIFLDRLLKLMVLSSDENYTQQKSQVLTQLYDYYYHPMTAAGLAREWLDAVPQAPVAYEDFRKKAFPPVTLLMYLKVCGGRHLICFASAKQLDELYKAGRELGIEIHAADKNKITWSRQISAADEREFGLRNHAHHLSKLEKKNESFSRLVQEKFNLRDFAKDKTGLWQQLRQGFKVMDFRLRATVQVSTAVIMGGITMAIWNSTASGISQSVQAGFGFATLWLAFSFISSAASDIFTKHSLRDLFSKTSEVLDDIKKRKAADYLFFSGLSIVPLYSLQQGLDLIFKAVLSPVAYGVLLFLGMALANGYWSQLQRRWRGYFASNVTFRDFFRGFFGYGLGGILFYFLPEIGPVGYAIVSKFFKEVWSALAEIFPGRLEKLKERQSDLREIFKDRDNSRLDEDIFKMLQKHSKRIHKIGLDEKDKNLADQIKTMIVGLHLLYLARGLSLGDDALAKPLKTDERQSLSDCVALLKNPKHVKKLLKVIFFSKEMNAKAEKFYEDNAESFISQFG